MHASAEEDTMLLGQLVRLIKGEFQKMRNDLGELKQNIIMVDARLSLIEN